MNKLKIAVQKAGRLKEESHTLLKSCGIRINNGRDQLKVTDVNFPIEVLYLRNSDIPKYVEDSIADLGIVGENLLVEQSSKVQVVQQLGFSKCRVSLAVPKDVDYSSTTWLAQKKIATSYPNTLKKFFEEKNVTCEIHTISGSVEIAPSIGLADGICDIVSSGSTLFKNGLKEAEVILKSQAVLVKTPSLSTDKEALLSQLLFRIKAVLNARNTHYILMNVPKSKIEEVTKILPVLKSPTVLPLAVEGWCSMHSVINENEFWSVIEELKQVGAEDILVVPIDKMVA